MCGDFRLGRGIWRRRRLVEWPGGESGYNGGYGANAVSRLGGGGGGSYIDAAATNVFGFSDSQGNTGNGYVSMVTPEPAGWILLVLGGFAFPYTE